MPHAAQPHPSATPFDPAPGRSPGHSHGQPREDPAIRRGSERRSLAFVGLAAGAIVATCGLASASQSGGTERPAEVAESAPKPPAAAAEPTDPKPSDPESVRKEKELELRRRFLPEPLTQEELDEFARRLGLDAAAKELFDTARGRYLEASAKARDERGRELLRLLPAAFRFSSSDAAFQPVHTPELINALRLGEAIGADVVSAEEALARDLGQLADAAHRPSWRRLRAARAETLYAAPVRLPGARVNLLELLPKAGLATGELESLDLLLDRYTDRYVEMLRTRHRALRSNDLERSEALVALGPEWRAGRTIPEALDVERELAEFDILEVRSDAGLRDLNAETIERIRKSLPPPAARRVLAAWQAIVHPEIFEEERLFRALMEEYLAIPSIEPEARNAAIDRLVALEDQLWPVGQQAIDLADSMVVAERLPPVDGTQVRIALEGQMHKLLTKRRKLVRDAIGLLAPSVPAELTAAQDRLKDTLATLAAQDRASAFLVAELARRDEELRTLLAMGETPAAAAQNPATGTTTPPQTVPVGDAPPEAAEPTADETAGDGNPPGAEEAPRTQPPPRSDRSRRDGRGSRRDGPR